MKRLGIKLAYHNHDTEMRQSAREFHHMLRATDAEHVHLCLDAHWIYRGAGDSQIALFDIIDMYVNRVVELHLRQSRKGIWTEDFCQGDVEYPRLVKILKEHDIRPHLVMEQAVEPATENSLNAVEAHKLGLEYARSIFSG